MDKMAPSTLSKKVDHLQSVYGVPQALRSNLAEDLIESEFSTIWKNVLSFKHNILESNNAEVNVQPQAKPKTVFSHRAVILENRSLKFKSSLMFSIKPSIINLCQTQNSPKH